MTGSRLFRMLVVACVALAVAAGFAGVSRAGAEDRATGPITSTEARQSGLRAATTLTERVLSYDWKRLDADVRATEKVLAPSFRAEYAQAMAGVKAQTLKNKLTLTATAVSTSVVSASPQKVVALVYVDQGAKAAGTTNPRIYVLRVLVTLTRGAGEWRVSTMDRF